MKIGILGGTFNPPHVGHCILAEYLLDELNLDKIIFIPSSIPPHKESEDLIPAEVRYKLTALAVENNPRFMISRLEIDRGSISYTIDTINELEKMYPNAEFYLILGADNLNIFHKWKEYKNILQKCTLVALNRPGFNSNEVERDVLAKSIIVNAPQLEISSTEIRERIREGKSVKYMVAESVEREIREKGLYIAKLG